MAVEDFLITFRADTSGALASIQRLAAAVQTVGATGAAAQGFRTATTAAQQFGSTLQANVTQSKFLGRSLADLVKLEEQAANRLSNIRTQTGGIGQGGDAERRALTDLQEINTLLSRMGQGAATGRLTAINNQLRQIPAVANPATLALARLTDQRAALEKSLGDFRLRTGTEIGQGGFQEFRRVRELVDLNKSMQAFGDTSATTATKLRTFSSQLDQIPASALATDRALQSSFQSLTALREKATLFQQAGLGSLPRSQLNNAFVQSISQMRAGIAGAADNARFFADRINELPPAWDAASDAFGRHARRIAEGIIIYDALGRVVQGVADTIKNIADVTRERIRFEAVVGDLGASQQSDFVNQLGDVAVRTNTQMADLASVLDTVGASLQGAGDASKTFTDSMEFLNDVGQFTNITQRDVALETDNLIGLFNLSGDSVDEFSDRLGRIVVAGHNSSSIIAEITDGLNEVGRAAASAGFDFDIFTALAADVIPKFKGAISGRELGAAVTTFIGKLGDPTVVDNIEKLSGGLIQVRDSMGNLRRADDVFIDISRAMKQGALDSEDLERVIDQIVPALNPAQRSTIMTLLRELPDALTNARAQMEATRKDARDLSEALVAGPAETVSRAFIALGVAAQQAFSDDVIAGAGKLASFISVLTNALSFLGTGLGGVITQFAVFAGAAKILTFGLTQMLKFFFSAQVKAAALAFSISEAGTASTVAAGGMLRAGNAAQVLATKTGGAIAVLKGLGAGALAAAKSFGPLLAVWLALEAIDFAGHIAEQNASVASSIVSDQGISNIQQVDAAIASLQKRLDEADRNPIADAFHLNETFADEATISNLKALRENFDLLGASGDEVRAKIDELQNKLDQGIPILGIGGIENRGQTENELDSLRRLLGQVGEDGVVGLGELQEAFTGLNLEMGDNSESLSQLDAWINKFNKDLKAGTQGVDELTSAEERMAAATELNNSLGDTRASILSHYLDQLEQGRITLDQFNTRQSNLGKASEVASKFITTLGGNLGLIPGLQERIARTGEDAATALTHILSGGNQQTVDDRIAVVEQMIAIEEANLEAKESLEANPIQPKVDEHPMFEGNAKVAGILGQLTGNVADTQRFLATNRPTPELDLSVLRTQLQQALQAMQVLKRALGLGGGVGGDLFSTLPGFLQPDTLLQDKIDGLRQAIDRLKKSNSDDTNDQTSKLLEQYRRELAAINDMKAGDERLNDTIKQSQEKPETALTDVGDLSDKQVRRAISLARALQASIPGATKDAKDETVALIRDARFLQFIRGLDQKFLAEAIQELTDVEKKRLELEQQRLQDVTRSIVTQVGPIQSLVSSPVLSAGGGLLSGQGLNADPRLGNVTINVPINWSGMSLRDLQRFIARSISRAWVDAARGGG